MSDRVRPTLEDLTECWCGYEAVSVKDLTLHQLYCDPHNTAPKVIDDQRKRIAELEAQLAYEQERNANNVANAQLQIDELTSEYQTWRIACNRARERADAANAEITRLRSDGCAREQGATQWCGAMQEMVSRLTALAEEWRTTETSSLRVNEILLAHADALREAIAAHSGEGE